MDIQSLRSYTLSKKGAEEDFPFGEDVMVIKVGGKMFALISERDGTPKITLKCDPVIAGGLRQKYSAVTPGYYMNKQHWNTVEIDGSIPDNEIMEMVDLSYALVFKGLKKAEREKLGQNG
ncbi:MAG: MmcQ/YjbR family DNA-binding protein [Bacillota bacterium]